ncbi:MAG: hypothetical protein FWH17_00320 [Oscillospiraceae bacterium]|nr:hypothetical protein [Oscillospiraceae bacterium]
MVWKTSCWGISRYFYKLLCLSWRKFFRASYGTLGHPGSALLPIRAAGVSGTDWICEGQFEQLSFLGDERERQRRMLIDRTMDDIRNRFGHKVISRGTLMADPRLGGCNPKEDHIRTFPGGYGSSPLFGSGDAYPSTSHG